MDLPKINGKIDTDVVADMIVSKIIAELGCMSSPKERTDLRHYVKEILDSIKPVDKDSSEDDYEPDYTFPKL